MRRSLVAPCLCVCLYLAACGGSGGGLPDGAHTALADYIMMHYGGVSWQVRSAQQSPDPEHFLTSNFPDEVWCVLIAPPLVAPDTSHQQGQDHFFVARSGADWSVPQAPAPTPENFQALGCKNG